MTYDPRVPARERTPFGAFQLHPSHLITGPQPDARAVDAGVARSAALTVCDQTQDLDAAKSVLDMLGLLDEPDLLLGGRGPRRSALQVHR